MFTENELREILSHWDIPQDLPIPTKTGADYLAYKTRTFEKESSAGASPFIVLW